MQMKIGSIRTMWPPLSENVAKNAAARAKA